MFKEAVYKNPNTVVKYICKNPHFLRQRFFLGLRTLKKHPSTQLRVL